MTLQKVWIVVGGSRGDNQPYIAVGAALVERGYDVTFFTYESYTAFAETFGMKGVGAIGELDYESSIGINEKIHRGMAEGNALMAFGGIAEMNRTNAPRLCQKFLQEIEKSGVPDICLAMPFSQYLAWYLYVHHGVPFLQLTTFAFAYNPDHVLLGLPKLPFGLTYYILHHIFVGGAYDGFKAYEEYLNAGVLDIFTRSNYIAYYKQPTVPMVTLCSPEFASVMYASDISPMWRFVGSTVIPRDKQLGNLGYFGGPQALARIQEFLNAADSSKPVYLGWGSMICKSPEHMVELCCRAVRASGQRAIVLGGAAGLSLQVLMEHAKTTTTTTITKDLIDYAKENILFVDFAPHEWLFPQVAATVHHGGAGTITAALRGGVPTIVTPVFGDQFDFSFVVNKLGVGIGFEKQFQKLGWKELGDAIKRVVSDKEMADRAAELGAKLRQEDGANRAVDEMERYWKEFCVTGLFHKCFPLAATEVRKPTVLSILQRVLPVAMVVTAAAVTASVAVSFAKKSR